MTKPVSFDPSFGLEIWDTALFVFEDDVLARVVKINRQDNGQGSGQGGGMPGQMPGGMGSGMSGSMTMGGTAAAEDSYELFPLDGTVIMTVTPMEKVSVTFNVDELDILSISKGQEALISMDALPGQSFRGIVSEINTSGENRKYSVTVSFDRTEKMLAGYNCSVIISVDTKDGILTVPVEAQSEKGGHSYLYTEYDKNSGELVSPVEIETGTFDGVNVEIVSGVEEGQQYWYSYYDKAPIQFPF